MWCNFFMLCIYFLFSKEVLQIVRNGPKNGQNITFHHWWQNMQLRKKGYKIKKVLPHTDATNWFFAFFTSVAYFGHRGQKIFLFTVFGPHLHLISRKFGWIFTKLSLSIPDDPPRSSWPIDACRIGGRATVVGQKDQWWAEGPSLIF